MKASFAKKELLTNDKMITQLTTRLQTTIENMLFTHKIKKYKKSLRREVRRNW